MGLESVELQVAIPRTVDAGKLQAEQQERAAALQNLAAYQAEKQEEINRSKVLQQEQSAAVKNERNPGRGRDGRPFQKEERKRKKTKGGQAAHPYKGKFIDISG